MIETELIDRILAEVTDVIAAQRLPTATYRLQLNRDFTFKCATGLVEYFANLGISHLYLSPIFEARSGSSHGYDVVNHSAINPEIGTIDDFRALAQSVRKHGLGLILDVVPNHMCAASSVNSWWRDVLENGPSSSFANYFDIDWMPLKPDLANKVLLPILGDQFGHVLENGQLKLKYADGAFSLSYYDHSLPIAPRSYSLILSDLSNDLATTLGAENPDYLELLSIQTAVRNLPLRTETDRTRLAERRREKEIIKRRLHELVLRSPMIAQFVERSVTEINGQDGHSESFDRLDALLSDQAYRLADWRVASDEINYRRFFDVNELAAICVEHSEVFESTHRLLFALLSEGLVDGLRIDHPDGLYDPAGYLRQLQERRFLQLCRQTVDKLVEPAQRDEQWATLSARLTDLWRNVCTLPGTALARPLYIVVEKILGRDETVPGDWLTHGTVGYDFLNTANGLFVEPASEVACTRLFERFVGREVDFRELAYQCKRLIARMSMASEVSVLGYQLDRISESNRWSRDFTRPSLTRALQEVIASFGVYRTYVADGRILDRDRQYIETAVARAQRRNPAMSESIFKFLRDLLLLKYRENSTEPERAEQRKFVGKFQQLTGPMMAKSIEDTAFYRFNRLVSLNEVGGEPRHFGTGVAKFHHQNANRLPRFSHGMLGTSTHDTKRSEDVRTRIDVLSEIPREWQSRTLKWNRWNQRLKTEVDGALAPSGSDEYLLYQTLIGIWPWKQHQVPAVGNPPSSLTAEQRVQLRERLRAYMLKVAREAKSETSWISPHEPYEQALLRFIDGLFEEEDRRRPFLSEVDAFAQQIAEHGCWNSLAQTLLKITSPGVPDFYQGCEQWIFTLVDPDNRHPVDFNPLRRSLQQQQERLASASEPRARAEYISELLDSRADGRLKLFVMATALQLRRGNPDLFTVGEYIPLELKGTYRDCAVAFARRHGPNVSITVVPRLVVRVAGFGVKAPLGDVWQDTSLVVPSNLGVPNAVDLYSQESHAVDGRPEIPLSELFSVLPLCCLNRA